METRTHSHSISLLCPACDRELANAEVSGDGAISYRIPTRQGASAVVLAEIPSAFRVTSIADVGAAHRWDGTPDHTRVRFPKHRPRVRSVASSNWCRATPELRADKLELLVRGAVTAGLSAVHLP